METRNVPNPGGVEKPDSARKCTGLWWGKKSKMYRTLVGLRNPGSAKMHRTMVGKKIKNVPNPGGVEKPGPAEYLV
jgi:hypothetical protein